MLNSQIEHIMKDGKCIMLAYDQGMEHGPVDFDHKNIDPDYILNIAEKGGYNALVLHHGVAEKYYSYSNHVPLLIKLNGKTNIPKIEPFSPKVCSVKRALHLGADIVGYTIYVGSQHEARMFEEFSRIVEEAHDFGIPVVAWCYPRGEFVGNPKSTETLAYAARVGLELGADFIKINYNNDLEGFKWVVQSAGKAHVLVAGGNKMDDFKFLQKTQDVIDAGACGLAVGRNVWQHKHPLKMTEAIKKVVLKGHSPEHAIKALK